MSAETSTGTVLVVDDDRINRLLLTRNLEAEGHTVTTAENGREALDLLQGELPDVILLDILMPVLDGFAVLDEVKADTRLRDIPVIMISAVDEMDSVVRCIEAGAEDYLPKPFNPTLLRARINAGLMKRRLARVEQGRVRDVFARFLPETVVDEVMRDTNGEPRLGGVRLVGTVLFSDLRGFTSFAEQTRPDVVVDVLNHYFSEMSDAILDNGGTLLGFLGDGILAVFGAPIASDDHADRALVVARQMLFERLPRFNDVGAIRARRARRLPDGHRRLERAVHVGQRRLLEAARVHGDRRSRQHRRPSPGSDEEVASPRARLRVDADSSSRTARRARVRRRPRSFAARRSRCGSGHSEPRFRRPRHLPDKGWPMHGRKVSSHRSSGALPLPRSS